ncbi:SDR family oxidoreductase [Actinacidiphila guanduensis]|uniref:NAD(P)-dependent dehydrogenase, short-chain alcohol dehydrogenase family n=1 Tax=Actinacidiphila guanduensis TaxID=310781 RepID=A0A1G9W4L0_9ACTN|nr:SDR family oxidoreductase [Actinacidiphila guanduensis]SDM79136.1 NAD(P)-dependent dehydrogenase, short-chain alcohol dehydrogenase family [Actinacidiphila guanduensis]
MHSSKALPDLSGRRVVVPGGTGAVGEGVVRSYLAAGADVVVPTRTQERAEEFRRVLGDAATDRLHLVVHDYTTFAGAEQLAEEMERRLGGVDDVVAPIGGWWGGKRLWEIDESDWQSAFVGLAAAHVAVLRAFLPRLNARGAYTVIVGDSAVTPVPGSGLVSMEQAALLMMRQVAAAETAGQQRVFALVLGPVRTRLADSGDPELVSAEQVGAVAVAASAAAAVSGLEIRLRSEADADEALAMLQGDQPATTGAVVAASTMEPKDGRRKDLLAVLAELAPQIRAEPGCLHYSVHGPRGAADGPLLIIQKFASIEAFTQHSASVADQIPRIAALLAKPPVPPTLYEPVL